MNFIVIIVLSVLAFILLMSGVFWFFSRNKGSNKKYPFLLYNNDGSAARKIEAKIRLNPDNKTEKVFVFREFDTKIQVKEPTFTQQGIAFREVKIGQRGELVLLSGHNINNEEYLNTAMESEEVTVATGTIIENNREFNNPMEKTTATLIIGMAVIALLIVGGCVYCVITLVNNSGKMLEAAKETSKTASALETASATNGEVTAQLANIAAALTGDLNLTRRLT